MNLLHINKRLIPVFITIGLFLLMYVFGLVRYDNFSSPQVFLNLFVDNAFLIIVAVGMTFVILSGGIDLSVGSVIALTSMVVASLLVQGVPVWLVIPIALLVGPVLGFLMGCCIHYFQLQPFIVTLAGMFLARGLSFVISVQTITIDHDFFKYMASTRIYVGDYFLSYSVLIALIVVVAAIFITHYTKFGRNVYAIGGSEQSAMLMGLPVGRTKIMVYTLSGFTASLAGIVFTFYMLSGYGLHANGFELNAIAAVVIGGTLLTGGVGYVAGSVVGVLILGTIQSLIVFEGSLSAWWTRIAIGLLLLLFIVLQRIIVMRTDHKKETVSAH
ncbi:galactofuranose ABC transporter, permease protein YjfF [Halalkalibacter sp. APA_J-10(15)]|uniref:galactofuranose ABC transporter, permease protein YjfF n=1 Tax=Halalkalibacter sp. APA_J-10(15) TaxID=2933805 RepID=UPI001FF265A0|nr:galactofuranose ABC transporter, permease protein YjfF [Halalkalibacter sp. APA_J-10(15)]MCK0471593.1 sugar ABC transporter permease YjfF [Halalkalibacter sp. APA_J-10(15)]